VIVPRDIARVFTTSATAVTAGYAMGALMLSLGTQIARDLIGSGNALVNGAALALFAVVTGSTALVARRLPGALAIGAGGISAAAAMALLMLAAQQRALPVFLVASALAGAGYSLLFLGGLTLINAHAPAHHRAGTLSAIYLIGYLLMGAIALSLGVAATHRGLRAAIDLGAPAIALLALAAAALAALGAAADRVLARKRPPGPGAPRRPVGVES
jgi:MFS family permease